jgi:ATP-binding protein involved in chromosome partitioning
MGLARMLPRTEVLVVTTPPIAAQTVASRAADMARRGHLRVAGVIENMAPFTCEHGTTYPLFGEGGGRRLADSLGAPLLGSIPLHPAISLAGDIGIPVSLDAGNPLAATFDSLARQVEEAAPVGDVEASGCTGRMLARLEAATSAAGSAGS